MQADMVKPSRPRKPMPTIAEYVSAPGLNGKSIKNKKFDAHWKNIKREHKEAVIQYHEKMKEWNKWNKEQQALRASNVKALKHPQISLPAEVKMEESDLISDV
jgi:hypothetical protein